MDGFVLATIAVAVLGVEILEFLQMGDSLARIL